MVVPWLWQKSYCPLKTFNTPGSFPLFSHNELLDRINSHSVFVSTDPAYAKHWLMWGLFTVMCYSHQTGLEKSQHVVLLLKHPREAQHQSDRICISSSVSSFFFSPSLWRPPLFSHIFLFPHPLISHTVSE